MISHDKWRKVLIDNRALFKVLLWYTIERFYKVFFGMISEKKKKEGMKSCSVVHIEQKMEFVKLNCFFIDFLRYSFGGIKVILTVVESIHQT